MVRHQDLTYVNGAVQLQEADIGSLLPRSLCGKSNTISVQRPSNDGSGNVRYVDGYHAFVVNEGQICVTPAEDAEIEEYINEVSALLEQVSLRPYIFLQRPIGSGAIVKQQVAEYHGLLDTLMLMLALEICNIG